MTENQRFEIWRQEQIELLTVELENLLPGILQRHTFNTNNPNNLKSQQLSLNAKIGGKHKTYINITDAVITSADEFVSLWLKGMLNHIKTECKGRESTSVEYKLHQQMVHDTELRKYVILFLKRTYWRNCYSLSKKRPNKNDAEIWIGQKNASYGILITPRFRNGEWENDVSEIRHFRPNYWTIGHILQTGFVIPHTEEKIEFTTVNQYLSFFKNSLVRLSGSPYELEIAEQYCEFVKKSEQPHCVPLLIPEFRYGGLDKQHKYRLDFTIINPYTLQKQGFEFSPWSTHGYLSGIKNKTQTAVNAEAKANFEKEMQKHKEYYRKYDVFTLIYTDSDLQNVDRIFGEMTEYLTPKYENKLLLQDAIEEFVNFSV